MTTDYLEAVGDRDAHSFYAIKMMARDAGMPPMAWSKAHPTLTVSEQAAFEAYMSDFDDWARQNPAEWEA